MGMCLRNTGTSTSMTLRNENNTVFLSALSGYFPFSMLSGKPVSEARCGCVRIAFTNTYEKCYREIAYSKVFLVLAILVILLRVKNDSIDYVLSSCKVDLAKLTNAGSRRSDVGQPSCSMKARSVYEVLELRFGVSLL